MCKSGGIPWDNPIPLPPQTTSCKPELKTTTTNLNKGEENSKRGKYNEGKEEASSADTDTVEHHQDEGELKGDGRQEGGDVTGRRLGNPVVVGKASL